MDKILSYYKTLNLNANASNDDVKKAYRKLAKKYHPDTNPGDPTAKKRFQKITTAYRELSNTNLKSTSEKAFRGPKPRHEASTATKGNHHKPHSGKDFKKERTTHKHHRTNKVNTKAKLSSISKTGRIMLLISFFAFGSIFVSYIFRQKGWTNFINHIKDLSVDVEQEKEPDDEEDIQWVFEKKIMEEIKKNVISDNQREKIRRKFEGGIYVAGQSVEEEKTYENEDIFPKGEFDRLSGEEEGEHWNSWNDKENVMDEIEDKEIIEIREAREQKMREQWTDEDENKNSSQRKEEESEMVRTYNMKHGNEPVSLY